jgi:predicted extracellular nuclease
MLVTFPQALVISEYFNFDRFGEIVLTTERQFQPTATYEPGSPEAAQLAVDNSLSRITLDDGRTSQNPDPAIHPNGAEFDLTNLFRGGDTVQNVTGVLDYAFGLYRVQPTQGANYVPANPRPEGPDAVGGTATVASFNVLNYFTTLDDGGPICGPTENMFCRGADTEEEFTRQRDKIIAALSVIDADIVGLIEIENHPGDVPTADLVSGLNALMGAGTYDYVATGAIGTDAIRQAFIYKPASVSLLGDFATLDSSVDTRFLDDYNRPALAQTFEVNETGGVFTAVVNHLKSKGSSCVDVSDPDTGDGSGNCNLTRTAAAEALVDWLATDPTGSGDGDFLIIGDLNAYDKEDPIDAILAGGYTDLVFEFNGEDAYSYVFDGQLGYLDHALSNAALTNEVTGTTIWHINADEPDLIDYDTSVKKDAQDAIYAPDAYRSSDHDPVIVGLDLCEATPPQFDTLTVTPEVLWPANHKYVDVSATVVASDNFDPSPFVTLVSVTSNEPDNGEDDGNTVDDIVIVDDYEFKLRAERSGIGTGRTYTITYEATDSCGNSAIGSAIVSVPLGRGK